MKKPAALVTGASRRPGGPGARRLLELDCRASNQRGELVMTGTARVMVTA